MRKRWIWIGLIGVLALSAGAAAIVLAPGRQRNPAPAAEAVAPAEQARTIAELRPPKRERPVIAIVTLNEATEVTDFLSSYGVLARAGVADVTVVAGRAEPVRLKPLSFGAPVQLYSAKLWIEPQATMREFDERHADGADYVVVPAIETRDDRAVTDWIVAQHRKGATIVSVCNGSLTLAAAGLLDGRRATAHWSGIPDLQAEHPTMQWVPDRRYVVDEGVMTTTGITATIPAMAALVEAIAGRAAAERVAAELGLEHWDARHRSSDFQLTGGHKKTFVRNTLSFWRHDTVGVPVQEGVDEIALGLTVDAYARTAMTRVLTIGTGGEAARSRHGLLIRPETAARGARVERLLPPARVDTPALALESALADIESHYGRPTAALVALIMEYPWSAEATTTARE